MGKTLYKRTHLLALSIFAGLMLVAGSAVGLMLDPGHTVTPMRAETLGRFVVTPKQVHFVPAGEAATSHR